MDKNVEAFKKVAGDYFNQLGISALRSYGRHLELRDPTTKKKADLIAEILGVLCGEMSTKRNNRGAPIKNNYVEPAILETVERLKSQFLYKKEKKEQTFNEILEEFLKNSQKWNILTFHDNVPQKTEKPRKVAAQTSSGELILRGQLETFENVACLLPENGDMQGDKIYLPAEFVQKFDLRDGDVVVCYAKRNDNTVIATEVLTVNDEPVKSSGERRIKFEDCDVCEAEEKLDFGAEEENPVLVKYLNWLLPMMKGQRGCIRSAPKTGKTSMIFELAKATAVQEDVKVFVLLLDQTPEIVSKFKKVIPTSQLVAMTFETDAERQVYAAELLLRRAKRYVESGYPTLLFVDSFNALAHAYNETDWSSGGKTIVAGLETKTLSYVKRFFGNARCIENGESLTILGGLTENTGNPADDVLVAELSRISNYQIRLNENLVKERIFPAIDYKASILTMESDMVQNAKLKTLLRKKLVAGKEEILLECLEEANTQEELLELFSQRF